MFAHRGGSKIGPENTIEAFDRGLTAGADGLELDVHLSRDGIVVVHHDATLDRTTRATGPLADRTAGELAELDVPTLRDVLERYPNTGIIIELKEAGLRARPRGRRRGAPCRRGRSCVPRIVQRDGAACRARDRARHRHERRPVRSQDGVVPIVVRRLAGRVPYQAFQVPETSGSTRVVSPRFVELAHRAGIAVQVWTVDEPADIRRLLDWGVDGIISDRPDVAAEVVE